MKEQIIDGFLKASFFRQNCPETMSLVDFSEGWGTESFRKSVRTHLDRCPHCSEEFERLEIFVNEID